MTVDPHIIFKSGSGLVISGKKLGKKRLCGMGIGHGWQAFLAGPHSVAQCQNGAIAPSHLPREKATSIFS